MAGEYKLFQPKKGVSGADWTHDVVDKIAAFGALEKAGPESRDDLQLFLDEAVWAVLRGDLTVAHAVEFFSKTAIPAQEPLQRLLGDVLWLVGFAATEAPVTREMRDEFHALCAALEKEAVLPRNTLALALEMDSVPPAVCQVAALKKKHNQAKTKARYTITRYNLLREHTEGYAKLLFLLERLSSLEFEPKATQEEVDESAACLVEDVVQLAGFSYLCPNRILSMALDIYEKRLNEADPSPLAQPMVTLMRRFPRKRLTEVITFNLLAHNPAMPVGRDARSQNPPMLAPSRPTQFLAIATLIANGMVDLEALWPYLEPTDAAMEKEYSEMMAKYQDEVSKLSTVDIGGSASDRDKVTFGKLFQAFNQSGHQKFRLAAALISVNCWDLAERVLLHIKKQCKPCLNHHVRSALCDLLKWLIWPLLEPTQKQPGIAKFGVETTFSSNRRFDFGTSVERKEGGEPQALRPAKDIKELIPQMRQILDHLEYFLHTDMHLLTSLWKVLALHLQQRGAGEKAPLDDILVGIIYRHLLPAASLVPHNPQLSDLMWKVMSQLSVFQRFLIYSCWEKQCDGFLLKMVYEKTRFSTKQILKRVVANAERRDLIAHQSHFHICKLCHSNPIPAIETMLRDVEIGFNVNMIQPYVECTNKCSEMTADVMGFVLSRLSARPVTSTRAFLNQADATLSSWLTNLGEFAGRFYKKHPQTDLVGLLHVIVKRINSDAPVEGERKEGAPPAEYKGEALIRVVFESLLEHMGGFSTVADMNADQLLCLAGGPRLKSESISIGKKEDSARKERTRVALFNALVDLNLVKVLWFSLSQQRHHFLSEEFSEAHSGGGGLKLLGLLFDGNHELFLKLTEFLTQACNREKYATLMPPLQQVFIMFEPALAFMAIRHSLAPFGRSTKQPPAVQDSKDSKDAKDAKDAKEPAVASGSTAAAVAKPDTAATGDAAAAGTEKPAAGANGNGEAAAAAAPAAAAAAPAAQPPVPEHESIVQLEKVIRQYLPERFESDGLSMQFYVTFWRLSLPDILVPSEGYEKAAAGIAASMKQLEVSKRQLERDRDFAHNREYKALKKEGVRLQDFQAKLKEEQLSQTLTYQKVLARLEQEKTQWFTKPSPHATSALVAEMICPRVLTSYSDALFCCHFFRLLIRLKTPGFQLLDFYNSWTVMLTQCIRCCSEREAQIFGVFLREMMAYVLMLRKDEATYNAEMKDNPCFYRNYYEDPTTQKVEWAQFNDIRKGHSKWEGRIFKAMRQGLDSEDWMEKRNALLMLSQSYTAFPTVEKYARAILLSVENMRDKEESSDLKTLANSLAVRLKHQREQWVDKAPASSSQRADGSRRQAGGTASSKAKADDSRANGPADGKGDEKRARRDADGHDRRDAKADAGGDKAHKEHKEGKESKDKNREAKARDGKESRGEAKEVKRAHSSKEAVDKPRGEKDRDREKPREDRGKGTSDKEKGVTVKEASDRKRSATAATSGSDRAAAHDDRGEKRRRTERDDGMQGRDRGADRGSDRYGHQPRNALAPAPDPPSGYGYSSRGGSAYDRRGGSGGYGSSRHGDVYRRR